MKDEYEIEINGEHFYINHYDGGWAWWTAKDEQRDFCDSPIEAMQRAMDFVKKRDDDEAELERIREEEMKYGSYDDQVRKLYYDTRL